VAVIGARYEPGYDACAQFISELGATGATNGALVSWAFASIGVLVLAFLAFASRLLPPARRTSVSLLCWSAVGAAYLASAAFRCDPGCPRVGSLAQSVHNTFGFFEYAGALAGAIAIAPVLRASPRWRALAPVTVLAAVGIAAGFAALLTPQLEAWRGLSQRVAEVAIFGWVACASAFLLRR
jgi:hypothetical protein